MKMIIDGVMYNTETATEIAWYHTPLLESDLDFIDERLYQKQNGEFYLAGFGGPRTEYAIMEADGWMSGSDGIIPLSIDEAMTWVEHHCDADTYIRLFGLPDE